MPKCTRITAIESNNSLFWTILPASLFGSAISQQNALTCTCKPFARRILRKGLLLFFRISLPAKRASAKNYYFLTLNHRLLKTRFCDAGAMFDQPGHDLGRAAGPFLECINAASLFSSACCSVPLA
jgi:hypothetical protein